MQKWNEKPSSYNISVSCVMGDPTLHAIAGPNEVYKKHTCDRKATSTHVECSITHQRLFI